MMDNHFAQEKFYLIEKGNPHVFHVKSEDDDLFEIIVNHLYITFDDEFKLHMDYDVDANMILEDNSKIPIEEVAENKRLVKNILHKFMEKLVESYVDVLVSHDKVDHSLKELAMKRADELNFDDDASCPATRGPGF